MLNRMLRYADAIVKRGVDKLIDAIAYSAEPQTKNAETPQPQKRMDNGTDCGLAEQTITPMDEQCDINYNVLDRTPEMQRRDQADKGFVPVSKLVRNTMVTAPFNGARSDGVRKMWCSMRFAANAENIRTKGHKNKRYNVCVSPLSAENISYKTYVAYVFRAKRLTQTLYLLFLCPFVLMFSALATDFTIHEQRNATFSPHRHMFIVLR